MQVTLDTSAIAPAELIMYSVYNLVVVSLLYATHSVMPRQAITTCAQS